MATELIIGLLLLLTLLLLLLLLLLVAVAVAVDVAVLVLVLLLLFVLCLCVCSCGRFGRVTNPPGLIFGEGLRAGEPTPLLLARLGDRRARAWIVATRLLSRGGTGSASPLSGRRARQLSITSTSTWQQ